MRGTLMFKLPEEDEQFKNACNGSAFRAVLYDFDTYLRGRLKYEELPLEVHETLQNVRDKLYKCCQDYNVTVFD